MNENVNVNPYAEVYRKIGYYRANSVDASYHAYLDNMLIKAEKGLARPEDLIKELDESFARYQAVMSQVASQAQGNFDRAQYYAKIEEERKKNRNEVEYKIGAGVLSVIGSVFILVALVYFGKHYLNEFFQGILLYLAGALIVALAQLFLEKKLPKFSHIVTGIGFGVLYFSTIFSYLYLKMFSFWIALGILGGIALLNVVMARVRQSKIMEIICSLGAVSSIYAIDGKATLEQFLMIGGLILFVHLLLFVVPYKEGYRTSKIIRLCVMFAAMCYFNFARDYKSLGEHGDIYLLGYVLLSILVMFVCYVFNTEDFPIKCTSLSLISMACLMAIPFKVKYDSSSVVFAGGLFAICLIVFLLMIKKKEKWAAYSVFVLSVLVMALSGIKTNANISMIIVLAVLLVSKLLMAVEELVPIDAVITAVALIAAVSSFKNPLSYAVFAIALIGTIMCLKLKLYHEFLFMISAIAFAGASVYETPVEFMAVPIVMFILMTLLLLYNLIPTMQVEGIRVYNIISVSLMGMLVLYTPIIQLEGWKNIACMSAILVIGMITILTAFTKKFLMETNSRYIILALFLTYVAYFVDVDDLWISISLMLVAFILIAVGCVANRFEIRIYGLVLALLVCVKVAFYDFKNDNEFNRMVVFFVVGVLAIAISFAYLVLEKKEQKEMKEIKARQQAAQAPTAAPAGVQAQAPVQAQPDAPVQAMGQTFVEASVLDDVQPLAVDSEEVQTTVEESVNNNETVVNDNTSVDDSVEE